MRQCICQICVCGRHRCEHTSKRRTPFAKEDDAGLLTTEHKERYQPFGFQARQKPVIPPSGAEWKGDEPAVKLSTTKKDFVAFPIKKRSLIRPKESKAAKAPMAGHSTYRHDYKPKRAIPAEKVKIPEPEGKNGAMPGTLPGRIEGVTTYSKCYTPKPFQKREKVAAKECTLTEFDKPFTGETETALSYKRHPLQKREPLLQLKGTLKPDGDFTDVTTHQTDFTPKFVIPERPEKKKLGRWKPGEGKFESQTTHKHDYKYPLSTEKAISCAPKPDMDKTMEPFEGLSHYKQDFQPYKIFQRELPKWHPFYKPFKIPTQPFEGESTYTTDYEPPPEDVPQHQQTKPLKCNLSIPSAPMEKVTTFMRDYRRIDCPVLTKSFKPDIQYEKPKEKFSGCTITRRDYTPKEHEKPQISKAQDNLKPGKGPMDDLSMTMKDFQWLALECPATYIKLFGKDALPNYVFEKTEHGHDIFKRLNGKKHLKKNSTTKQEKSKRTQKILQK